MFDRNIDFLFKERKKTWRPGPWLALGLDLGWPLAWPWLALGLTLGWPLVWLLARTWPDLSLARGLVRGLARGWPWAWPLLFFLPQQLVEGLLNSRRRVCRSFQQGFAFQDPPVNRPLLFLSAPTRNFAL